MKINQLLEGSASGDPAITQNNQQAPKFGRHPTTLEQVSNVPNIGFKSPRNSKVLEKQVDETVAGCVATVAQPLFKQSRTTKESSISHGIKSSKKYRNSPVTEDELSEEQLLAKQLQHELFTKAKLRDIGEPTKISDVLLKKKLENSLYQESDKNNNVFSSMASQLVSIGSYADKIKHNDPQKIESAIYKKLHEIDDPKLTHATKTLLQKTVEFNRKHPKIMAAMFGLTFAIIARVSMEVSHRLGLSPTQATLIIEATLPTLGNFLGYLVNGFSIKDSIQSGLIAGSIGVAGTLAASGALKEQNKLKEFVAPSGSGDDGNNERKRRLIKLLSIAIKVAEEQNVGELGMVHAMNTIASDDFFGVAVEGILPDITDHEYTYILQTAYNKVKHGLAEGEVIPFKQKNPLTPNLIKQLKALSQTALEIFWEGSYMPTAAQGQMAQLGKNEEQRLFKQNEKHFKSLGYEYSMNEEDSDILYLHSIAREQWYEADKPANQYNGLPDLMYNKETNTLSYYDLIGDDGYEYTDTTQFENKIRG